MGLDKAKAEVQELKAEVQELEAKVLELEDELVEPQYEPGELEAKVQDLKTLLRENGERADAEQLRANAKIESSKRKTTEVIQLLTFERCRWNEERKYLEMRANLADQTRSGRPGVGRNYRPLKIS